MATSPSLNSPQEFYPPNGVRRRLSNASVSSVQSSLSVAPQQQHLLYAQSSRASVYSLADSETESIVHSPTPRRHFLVRAESQRLLRGQQSPVNSPPTSPTVATNNVDSTPSALRSPREKKLSFSSLHDNDRRGIVEGYLNTLPGRDRGRDHVRKPKVSITSSEAENLEMSNIAGRRWVRWMYSNGMRRWIVPCAVCVSAGIKWCIGLSSYSGANTPPMFGDYEAQRHWMELTTNLPTSQWYKYDLQYWGLDYPPLTAYHSWICGLIGSWINPSWFALDGSRGIETDTSKVFMRSTVLVSDLLVYIPALLFFLRTWHENRSRQTRSFALLMLLLQPSLLLIDSGHFQYNSVMLGLTLLSMNFFAANRDLLGAVSFVASLGFKQMSLYYAPVIGSYLLGKCFYRGCQQGSQLFLQLAVTTIASFYILFLPFLPPFASFTSILDPLTRIFPFGRGLFEDKVANFWCASNVIIKWRNILSQPTLIKLSAALTILGFLPIALVLALGAVYTKKARTSTKPGKAPKKPNPVHTPTLPLLPYALLASSMSFFLFSFQVHEKTILVPLLPMTLIASGAPPTTIAFELGGLVNNVAAFSMWPLLKKDGLGVQYIALLLLWNWVVGYNPLSVKTEKWYLTLAIKATYSAIALLHTVELLFSAPARYPDLFPVLNVLITTPVFAVTWLWSMYRTLRMGHSLYTGKTKTA